MKKVKRRKRLPVKTEYVTRDMLATLRDEIEEVLEDARYQIERAGARPDQLAKAYSEHTRVIEKLQADVDSIRSIFGLDKRRYARVRFEPVTWSYFHVWISRINERLERLEKMKKHED